MLRQSNIDEPTRCNNDLLVFRWFIPVVRAYKYMGKWVCTSNTTIFIGVY